MMTQDQLNLVRARYEQNAKGFSFYVGESDGQYGLHDPRGFIVAEGELPGLTSGLLECTKDIPVLLAEIDALTDAFTASEAERIEWVRRGERAEERADALQAENEEMQGAMLKDINGAGPLTGPIYHKHIRNILGLPSEGSGPDITQRCPYPAEEGCHDCQAEGRLSAKSKGETK